MSDRKPVGAVGRGISTPRGITDLFPNKPLTAIGNSKKGLSRLYKKDITKEQWAQMAEAGRMPEDVKVFVFVNKEGELTGLSDFRQLKLKRERHAATMAYYTEHPEEIPKNWRNLVSRNNTSVEFMKMVNKVHPPPEKKALTPEQIKKKNKTKNDKAYKKKLKLTATKQERLKDALHMVYEGIGGIPRMTQWADENPTEFYRIWAKLLPTELQATVNVNVDYAALLAQGRQRALEHKEKIIEGEIINEDVEDES